MGMKQHATSFCETLILNFMVSLINHSACNYSSLLYCSAVARRWRFKWQKLIEFEAEGGREGVALATTDSEEQEYTLIYCVTRYVSFRSSRINLGQSVLNVVKKGGEAAYAMVALASRRGDEGAYGRQYAVLHLGERHHFTLKLI